MEVRIMKAVVTLRRWEPAENPTCWRKFDEAEHRRYLFDAENLEDAQMKILKSFPSDWCIGYSLSLENGDFAMDAVLDYWMYDAAVEDNREMFGVDYPTVDMIVKHKIEGLERRMRCAQ